MINLKYIWNLILNNKKILIWGQIITVLSVIISVPIPLMLPALVDEVLLNKPNYFVPIISNFTQNNSAIFYIIFVTFLVVILRIVYYLLSIFITKIFTRISKHVIFEIRKKILLHLKKVCMNEYESLGSGAISANLITDVNTLDTFIMSGISKFITSVLTLLAVIIVIITIHPALGLSILLIQPTIMYFSNKIAKKVGLLKKEENKAIEIFQDNIGEYLDLFGQIKASNKEDYFFNQAINKAKNIQDTSNEFGFKSVVYERFSFTIFLASFEILRGIGLLMVAYSDLSIGMMMAMFGYIWFIMAPVQDMLSIQYSYATTIAALTRINKILKLKKEPSGNKLFSKNKNGISISIRNLDFSYNKDKKTLNNISLEIKSGEKVALIGPSGSGKTTLAQLIAGFYTKSSGIQKYNNIQIESISKNELRKEIFLVLQMPILFNNTLKFNITMGDDSISDEEIYNALELAQLKDVVLKMKNTINTIVGKNGVRLSGGQKQRLSIARMIIANASIIIFDESTSALDVKTETKLFKDLESFFSNKTIITIAHRLSTVRNANKIYMLNEGQIIQSGSHEELEKQEGQYLEFVKNQLI